MNTAFTASDQAALPCRLTLTDNTCLTDELISLTYTSGCSDSTTGPSLGTTVAATFTVKLAGTLPALEGAYVTLEVQTEDGTWTSLGKFRFETPETGEGVTTVTAVDAMLWALEQGYYPSNPAPTTALGVLRDLCSQAGVELGDISGLTDVSVTGSLTGYTMRETAGYMAALLGRNALFGPDGKLELRWFIQTDASIGPDNYYSGGFTRKDCDWTISGLTCSTGPNEEDVLSAGNPGSTITLSNPYMTQSALDDLWSALQDFAYRPGEVTLLGDLSLEPGDLVTVTDCSGSSYTLAIMSVEHSYDGGWKTKITAYGSAESDTGASYKGPNTVAMERYAAEMASFKKLFADEAYLQSLFVQGGIIANDISAVEISASRYLTGVTIVGDVIQAGTLSAKKLIITGEDGLIYELNAQGGQLTAQQLTEEQYRSQIDGSVLVAHSVTADRINVTDLFAQDITATGTIRGVTLEGATGSFTGTILTERQVTVYPDGADALEDTVFVKLENGAIYGKSWDDMNYSDAWNWQLGDIPMGLCFYRQNGTQITHYSRYGPDYAEIAGNLTASGHIFTSGNYYLEAPYTSQALVSCYWADGARHSMLARAADGLTCNVGYPGTASCPTILQLRSQTVKVTNASGTSTLSDERMKKDWKDLDDYDAFFDALNPQAFRYIDGASGRYHLGFGAQSVEQALADSGLDNMDFGGLVHYPLSPEEENSKGLSEEYSLIYTEFVALLTDQVQKLKKKVEVLEHRLEALEQTAN